MGSTLRDASDRRRIDVCTSVLHLAGGVEVRSPIVDEIGIRELRNHVAAVVRRAAAGERIVVTVDGVAMAQLGPLRAGRAR